MRLGWLACLAMATSGCSTGIAQGPPPAIPIGPLAPIQLRADAPPLECRGLPVDRCQGLADVPLKERDQVLRVIVSCEGAPCTEADGAFRIDTLMRDGSILPMGRGTYGEGVQPVYPPAP